MNIRKNILYILCISVFVVFFYFLFLSAPSDFPKGSIIKIESGSGLRSVSLQLKQAHIIRSRTAFEAFVIIFGSDKRIISTDYFFKDSLPVYVVANRISRGKSELAPIIVTIPEGFDNAQIADTAGALLLNFNKNKFLLDMKNNQGYLFPDTYFFLNTDTESEVEASMQSNFEKKIAPLVPDILLLKKTIGRTEKDIITMASVIEREAKGDADRALISGILWRRIAIGMPLQVDAAPETYKSKGLPISPISNPGLEAIRAAISPTKSPYLYYLHDKNGVVHYAKTFVEHIQNKAKYL